MKKLFLLAALTACAPEVPDVSITLLSISDQLTPQVDLELTFEADGRQAFLRLEGEPIPVTEPIFLIKGFREVPLKITTHAFIGEREVGTGSVDIAPGQKEATIRFSVCSNGAPEAEELCDDANVIDGDGCDSTCKPTGCGSDVFTEGETCFSPQNAVIANAPPSDVRVEDTNNDQILDLIASYPDQGKVRIFFGSEDNQFGDFFEVNVGVDARLVSVADLNQDGNFDFVVNTKTNFVVFTGRGDGTFLSGQNFFAGQDIRGLALADLDGDQLPEQILLDFGQNLVRTLPSLGDGTFEVAASNSVPVDAQPVALSVVDIDQDGDKDIITANLSGSISVLLNSAGTLTANFPINTNGTPIALTTADFNGDGKLDIGVIKQGGTDLVSLFKQINANNFQAAGNFAAPNNPSGLTAADVDLDGDIDLAVTSQSVATVTILVNNGQGQFPPAEAPFQTTTSPKAITTGDINRDGLPDFVTAGQDLGLLFSTP